MGSERRQADPVTSGTRPMGGRGASIIELPAFSRAAETAPVTFTAPTNYATYVVRTTEKHSLERQLVEAYWSGALSVRPGDRRKRILDLGSGLGTNTIVLASLFQEHEIHAVDVSRDFAEAAAGNLASARLGRNATIFRSAFEDFDRYHYDFVLCSHVLQYIDTPLDSFLRKIVGSLKADGEAWIVLQERRGISQLVQAATPFMSTPSRYFRRWFTHQQVRELVHEIQGIQMRCDWFPSCFRAPSLIDPSEVDIALLNFFLLDGFEPDNAEMLEALRSAMKEMAPYGGGYLPHDVGITRIRRGL